MVRKLVGVGVAFWLGSAVALIVDLGEDIPYYAVRALIPPELGVGLGLCPEMGAKGSGVGDP
jgi:hypothetical protein